MTKPIPIAIKLLAALFLLSVAILFALNPSQKITVYTTLEIDAPIANVWAVIGNINGYAGYDFDLTFPQAPNNPVVGSPVKGQFVLVNKEAFTFESTISSFDENQRLAWKGGYPLLINGEHYIDLEVINSEKTRMIHGENFRGLLLPLFHKIHLGNTANFSKFNHAVKWVSETNPAVSIK